MTSSSPKTASLPGWRTDPKGRLARLIVLAQAAIAIERILPALWPALGFAGAYLALALFGLFTVIPWTLQTLLLAATIMAMGLSLANGLAGFTWPRHRDGARRLERDSGLKHRPISESGDRLIGHDPFAEELWRLHKLRALDASTLRLSPPDPHLHLRDPKNLRYFVLLALAAGLVVARGEWRERLTGAFDSGAASAITLDAWVDPPPYTGLAPLYLAHGAQGAIAVPTGSILNLRVHGARHAPGAALGDTDPPRFTGDNGEYAGNARLSHDAHVRVRASGHVIGDWHLTIIPDHPPQIGFAQTPSRTEHDALKFSFKASDDYGVVSARAVLTPHGRPGKPLTVDLPLAQPSAKTLSNTTYADLTAHPYAGLLVDARLEARDAAGQTGVSRTVTFRLPARVFTDPLGRALIEQRQNLATSDVRGRRIVAQTLDALTLAPEEFYDGKANVYLGIRAAYWGVRTAHAESDITHVEDLLWQIAVSLEQSGMLAAADEMRRLQSMLTQALAAHAPQEVIDQLLQRYNEAMQRYLQALQNNPQAQAQQQQQQMQSGQDTKTITEQDIQALLKAIQQLSQSGNREQAAQMLALLQNLLENLHMSQNQSAGQGGQQNPSAQQKALSDRMQKLGEMMGKQRALLDKTLRQQEQMQAQGKGQKTPPSDLGKQQQQLMGELGNMMKAIGPQQDGALGDAGKAMGEAQHALEKSDMDGAGNAEKNALESLRKGAEALSKQMDGQQGESGQGKNGTREDPLGRGKSGLGANLKLPDATDMARAREILQELRKRAGERERPQQELDYLDRLLREF